MTGDNITINSNNFNVDKQGNMNCNNANITGGDIVLSSSSDTTPKVTVKASSPSQTKVEISPGYITTCNGSGVERVKIYNALGQIELKSNNTNENTRYGYSGINFSNFGEIFGNGSNFKIKPKDYFIVDDKYGNEIISFGLDYIYVHRQLNMCGLDIINAGNVSSDRRLKKEIKDSKISAIDRIMKMKHREFVWKKDNKKEEIGYIAQELEEIDPNYVRHNITKDEDGKITSDMYEVRVLPILSNATKAIQEQQKEIKDLKEIVNNQAAYIQSLINRIEKLEGGNKV